MRLASVLGITTLLLSMAVSAGAQNEARYKARLSPVPADAGMRNSVAGSGSATAVLKGATLTVTGAFEGLLSPATIARLHEGPVMGVRGASFANLTVSKAPKGTISGSIQLTPAQVLALKEGHLYIQLASEKAPDGNLWGWFVR